MIQYSPSLSCTYTMPKPPYMNIVAHDIPMQQISIKIPRLRPPLLFRRCDSKIGGGWGYIDFHCRTHIFWRWRRTRDNRTNTQTKKPQSAQRTEDTETTTLCSLCTLWLIILTLIYLSRINVDINPQIHIFRLLWRAGACRCDPQSAKICVICG